MLDAVAAALLHVQIEVTLQLDTNLLVLSLLSSRLNVCQNIASVCMMYNQLEALKCCCSCRMHPQSAADLMMISYQSAADSIQPLNQ